MADFKLLVLGYFDDRFGMTRDTFAEEEALLVTKVCDMFGVMVNNKTDFGDNIAFLGVGFDFSAGVLYVLDQRRKKIMAEIINIIKSNLLPSGQAEAHLSKAVWDKTMSDVDLGFTTGPFDTEDEVSNFLSTSSWIAIPRFPVEQSGSVRPVDNTSPTRSSANSFAAVSERLEVPTVDLAVTIARALRGKLGNTGIGGWTVDEKSAFRQIPVAPEHRRVAVVSLCRPDSGRAVYFCMLGHPFGLTTLGVQLLQALQSPD